ncbi:MAG: hypothetical protein U5M50_10325 [Sphingobium sp.]|nr:hypothetical protein [Sphingobium sp.]
MSMDIIARALASDQEKARYAIETGFFSRPPRPLVRIVHSRALNQVTLGGGTTFEMLVEVAAPFSRVQPILAAGQNGGATASSPSYFVWVAAVPNATKAAADAATWRSVSMATANYAPAPAINRNAWHCGADMTLLPSVPRDDGGSGRLVLIRVYMGAGTVVMLGNGTDEFTNWAARSSRMFRWREQPGDYTTANQAGFTSVTNANRSPIAGLAYMPTDGRGVTLAGDGDSNAVGSGETIGANHIFLACEKLTQDTGMPYEYAEVAWAGFASTAIRDRTIDLFSSTGLFNATTGLMPSAVHIPCATQNDWAQGPTVTTIDDATVATMEANLAQARVVVARAGVPVIRSTWQASTARVWNASDQVRRARNDRWRAECVANGDLMIDVASVIDGPLNGNGQAIIKAIYQKDTAHYNDAGHLAVMPLSRQAILAAVPMPRGMLFD